ncbi:MAG: YidC/Oxa1 family membrane protein insertase [Acidimicrobiaceae bacterium]|nr:YidC/Oxa1 family membrane protein insertase [Acidimicrobiaceae bacterium]
MSSIGQILNPIFEVIAGLLAFYYGIVHNYAIAIAMLTVTVMIVLAPLTIKSTRSMLEMQRIQPEIKKIQAKYKNDKIAQQEAISQLFKENKVSPAGGCLPMLAQFPLLYVMYSVIRGLTNTVGAQHIASPKYISHTTLLYQNLIASHGQMQSLGINLTETATKVHGFTNALPYYLVIVVAVVLQYLQMAQITSKNPQAAAANPQAQMLQKYTPIIFAVIYISIPAGVNIYFIVSSLFRIGQQELMYRHDPVLKKHAQANAEARLAGTDTIDHIKPKKSSLKSLFSSLQGSNMRSRTKPQGNPGITDRNSSNNGNNKPNSNGQKRSGQARPRGQGKNNKRSR